MDYLYDKVETYDKLKDVIQETRYLMGFLTFNEEWRYWTSYVAVLDNHDEQRLASPICAGTPEKRKPLMVVSTTISSAPTMIYLVRNWGGW
jgi:hypothetical protein